MQKHGKILERTIYDKNEIMNCEYYLEICLYNRKCEEIARAKIDKDDLEKVKGYKWYLNSCGYVVTKIGNKSLELHQLVLGIKQGFMIDHRNTDTLDNRKQNLRHCTNSQNQMNKNAKGYFLNQKKKWQVQIMVNKKSIRLGCFLREEEAKEVRKQAELKYFGEFACVN